MTTPDKDGWITHDGGPCPVAPDALTERAYGRASCFGPSSDGTWEDVKRYRCFAPAHTATGPSPFVRETAARIMAGFNIGAGVPPEAVAKYAHDAVYAALALLAALEEAGE
jgi:hypothetical protein